MSEDTREISRFDVPVEVSTKFKSIGVVELTPEEELLAARRARGDGVRLGFELAKLSLAEVNGEKVVDGGNARDKKWAEMSPKVRGLVLAAFGQVNSPDEDAVNGFLKSRKVGVG